MRVIELDVTKWKEEFDFYAELLSIARQIKAST